MVHFHLLVVQLSFGEEISRDFAIFLIDRGLVEAMTHKMDFENV